MNEALREELIALADIDQDIRARVTARWPGATPPDMDDPLYTEWEAVDEASTAQLKTIVATYGWPGYRLVGEDGADAAWLLVQHSPDREFMRECLGLIRQAVADGDASPRHLGYLEDRLLMYSGQPQIYGTQSIGRNGVFALWDTVDPSNLNERRATIGLDPL